MSTNTMLCIQNLSIGFVRRQIRKKPIWTQVVSNLNLEIHPGELVAIVGSSGAGKSVLAHAILGILPNNAKMSGEIRYKGQRLSGALLSTLRGKSIAFVPQSTSFLDPLLRVGDAVRIAARRSGLDKQASRKEQKKVFARFGLSLEMERWFPYQISGGMARRILLACAAVTRAKLIVADEPTPGLHPEAAGLCMQYLREHANQGKAALVISHDIEACLQKADRIAVFHNGSIVEVAQARDFSPDQTNVRHSYTKALLHALPSRGLRVADGKLSSLDLDLEVLGYKPYKRKVAR